METVTVSVQPKTSLFLPAVLASLCQERVLSKKGTNMITNNSKEAIYSQWPEWW